MAGEVGGGRGECVVLTTSLHLCADFLEIWQPERPGALRACPGVFRDSFVDDWHTDMHPLKEVGLLNHIATLYLCMTAIHVPANLISSVNKSIYEVVLEVTFSVGFNNSNESWICEVNSPGLSCVALVKVALGYVSGREFLEYLMKFLHFRMTQRQAFLLSGFITQRKIFGGVCLRAWLECQAQWQSTQKYNKYHLPHIYILPPDDGLLIRSKHVEVW
jgi:hypothetical protein